MKFDQYRRNDNNTNNGNVKRSNGHATTTTMDINPNEHKQFENFGLLIIGQTLEYALENKLKMKFLEL
ncbi:unnamed protein product, partial [Rotaria sp. Silwood2]